MKKKINIRLVLIAIVAVLSTMLLITLIYYDLFRRQVMEDLQTYSRLLGSCRETARMEETGKAAIEDGMRITLVGSGGNVLYDNQADRLEMQNHGARPEISEAFANGEGQAVRKSETLARSTFYYALRLEDGNVLRVAKEAGSLFSIFRNALPSLILVAAGLIGICMAMAHYLTRRLVEPISRLAENMEGQRDTGGYEELEPFFDRIRQQHEDIMKSARMRQEFTANVSHELKTPLTSISGYAELIENGMASESDVIRFARGIRSNATRLLTLINDIIRLSELDGEQEDGVMERLNLYDLAGTCVEMLSMNAERHGVTLELKGMECFITGNRQMIEELLYNLCDNAIRYNNEGGSVTVEAYPRHQGTVLKVGDTGIGIPREHQERIFERFYRVDKSRSKSTGGTGLGLAIVKHIIAKHNAEINLQSEAGKGTLITVYF